MSSVQKFRKKPVVIEAMQWDGTVESVQDILAWIESVGSQAASWRDNPSTLTINTLEGHMKVSAYDWVIRGVAGEFYPCKPDILDASYDHYFEPPTEVPTFLEN